MHSGYVARHVSRTNWTILLFSGIVLSILTLIVIGQAKFFYNGLDGPFAATSDELLDSHRDSRRQYFSVHFDRLIDTNFIRHETVNGVETQNVAVRYFAALVKGKVLIVEVRRSQTSGMLSGELKPLTMELRTRLQQPLEARHPEIAGMVAPVYFEVRNCTQDAAIAAIVEGAIGLFALIGLCKSARKIADPLCHPAYRTLSAIGHVEKLEQEIEAEMLARPKKLGPCRFTANWLVKRSLFQFQVMRVSELLWIYSHVQRVYYHGIPVNKNHFAVFCDRHGGKMMVPARKKQIVQQLLEAYGQIAPWAVVGFSKQTARQWRKDRQAMCAAADQRKNKLSSAPVKPLAA